MFNGAAFNNDQFNGSGFAVPTAVSRPSDQPYVIHVKTAAGVFLRKVEEWTAGSWSEKVNGVGSLKFSLPLDSTLVQTGDLVHPNRIHLLDVRMKPLRQFVILKTKANKNKGTFDVDCAGLLYLLKQEFVGASTITGATENMRGFVQTLLGSQQNANPITLGYIAPKYANADITSGAHSDQTIFTAIMNLWKGQGGVIGIDENGRMFWIDDTVGNPRFAMSLYEDIETYEETTNSDNLINKIFAKGLIHFDGSTHDRQVLAGVGFIQDTDSIATYDIHAKRLNLNLEDRTELTVAATRILRQFKDPQVTRNISAIDMSRVQLDPDNPATPPEDFIYIGSKIKVNPPSNVPGATTFSTMILSVTRSLSDFTGVKITIGEGAQPDKNGRRILQSDTEFFDILAAEFEDLGEFEESLYQEDDYIWDFLDDLSDRFGLIEDPETDVNQIQAVKSSASLGSNTKFAPSDHAHDGVIMVPFNASDTAVSDLGDPGGLAFGYLDAGAGTDEGLWFFPADGVDNSDWIPMPSYN